MQGELRYFCKSWLLFLSILVLIGIWATSCNTTKHTTSSQSNIDTSKTIQKFSETHSSIDSNTIHKSASNVEFSDSSTIKTQDDYTITQTNWYQKDSATGKQVKVRTETTKKGTKTKTENKNQKINSSKIESDSTNKKTDINQKENKSVNQAGKSQSTTSTKDKTVKVSPFKFGIGIAMFVGFVIFIFFVWRKFKKKVVG